MAPQEPGRKLWVATSRRRLAADSSVFSLHGAGVAVPRHRFDICRQRHYSLEPLTRFGHRCCFSAFVRTATPNEHVTSVFENARSAFERNTPNQPVWPHNYYCGEN